MPIKDLTGQRFGRLTALSPTGERRGTSVVWLCRCDCGRECRVPSSQMVGGRVRSCGCLQDAARRKDITGQRRGRLTAIQATPERLRGATVWIWRCDCGAEVRKPPGQVREGMSTMCPDCARALKRAQGTALAEGLARDPDTGVAEGYREGIVAGKLPSHNTSGVRGVSWHAGLKKWCARVGDGQRTKTIGYYDTIEEAARARAQAVRRRYGTKEVPDHDKL